MGAALACLNRQSAGPPFHNDILKGGDRIIAEFAVEQGGKWLGEGSFGTVRECVEASTGKSFAVKVIDHVAIIGKLDKRLAHQLRQLERDSRRARRLARQEELATEQPDLTEWQLELVLSREEQIKQARDEGRLHEFPLVPPPTNTADQAEVASAVGALRTCTSHAEGPGAASGAPCQPDKMTPKGRKEVEREVARALQERPRLVKAMSQIRNEVVILSNMDNRYVVRTRGMASTPLCTYIVLELCNVSLARGLDETRNFTQRNFVRLARDMAHALCYVHSRRVIHRDVKMQNWMLRLVSMPTDSSTELCEFLEPITKAPRSLRRMQVVLIDFGLACVKGSKEHGPACGTVRYMAPEMRSGMYDEAVDMWSLGVLVYFILFGLFPFEDADGRKEAIFAKARACDPAWLPSPDFPYPTNEAESFMRRLLCSNPKKRMRAREVLHDPFTKNYVSLSEVIDLHAQGEPLNEVKLRYVAGETGPQGETLKTWILSAYLDREDEFNLDGFDCSSAVNDGHKASQFSDGFHCANDMA